jgi:hypothetical protein
MYEQLCGRKQRHGVGLIKYYAFRVFKTLFQMQNLRASVFGTILSNLKKHNYLLYEIKTVGKSSIVAVHIFSSNSDIGFSQSGVDTLGNQCIFNLYALSFDKENRRVGRTSRCCNFHCIAHYAYVICWRCVVCVGKSIEHCTECRTLKRAS